jgi:hypothetical protein
MYSVSDVSIETSAFIIKDHGVREFFGRNIEIEDEASIFKTYSQRPSQTKANRSIIGAQNLMGYVDGGNLVGENTKAMREKTETFFSRRPGT